MADLPLEPPERADLALEPSERADLAPESPERAVLAPAPPKRVDLAPDLPERTDLVSKLREKLNLLWKPLKCGTGSGTPLRGQDLLRASLRGAPEPPSEAPKTRIWIRTPRRWRILLRNPLEG